MYRTILRIRFAAKRQGKIISAYLAELVKEHIGNKDYSKAES